MEEDCCDAIKSSMVVAVVSWYSYVWTTVDGGRRTLGCDLRHSKQASTPNIDSLMLKLRPNVRSWRGDVPAIDAGSTVDRYGLERLSLVHLAWIKVLRRVCLVSVKGGRPSSRQVCRNDLD